MLASRTSSRAQSLRSQLPLRCQLHQHQGLVLLHVPHGLLWRRSHVCWWVPSIIVSVRQRWCCVIPSCHRFSFERGKQSSGYLHISSTLWTIFYTIFTGWQSLCFRFHRHQRVQPWPVVRPAFVSRSQLPLRRQLHQHQGLILLHVPHGLLWRRSRVYKWVLATAFEVDWWFLHQSRALVHCVLQMSTSVTWRHSASDTRIFTRTTVTLMPTVPTTKARSTARATRATLETESRVWVSSVKFCQCTAALMSFLSVVPFVLRM